MARDIPRGKTTAGGTPPARARLARLLPWRWRPGPVAGGGDHDGDGTLSTRLVGQISSSLFLLAGVLVIVAAAVAAFPAGASRLGLGAVGVATVGSGVVIGVVPWQRWRRSATLWLVPVAFALIVLHEVFSANDGYIYALFYVFVFVWLGLGHPPGTSLRFLPVFALAYVTPLLAYRGDGSVGLSSTLYVVPSFVLTGETVAWVAERLRRSEEALTRSGRRFRALVEGSADIITLIGADGTIAFETPAVRTTLGYEPTARVGRPARHYVHPEDVAQLSAAYSVGLDAAVPNPAVVRLRHADGGYRWCEIVLRNLLDDPAVGAVVANFSDVTARHEAEARLAESEASFRQLFAQNPQPMWVYERATLAFLEVNEAATDHYGYGRDEFLAMAVPDIWEESDRQHVDFLPRRRGEDHARTWTHVAADGRRMVVELASHDLSFGGRDAVLVAVKDVTAQTQLEAQLSYRAFHDPLTELPNRALFRERVEYALSGRAAGGVLVLFLDLDRFKTVNDSLGHGSGDELIVAVARRLVPALRDDDTLARLGGDEFAVLTVGGADDGEGVARRLLDALRPPFAIAGGDVSVSASIGVAGGPGTADDLLRHADVAMYRAKAAGRNRFVIFDPAAHGGDHHRLRLESDLQHAIERDELRVLYQPVVELGGETTVGFEALARWEHPELGTISPLDFIPIAEDTGMIVAVGAWILDQACAQARRWQIAYPGPRPLTMAVNVSARQLQEPTIVDEVRRTLERHGTAPSTLTLEITESVLLDESSAIGERLVQLERTGVRLAIDDFGTGYSSLTYLRQFPIDILKIDRSFTNLVEGPGAVPPLLEGLVFLGHQLGLELVAEGIETTDQKVQLERLACRLGQGFLWAEPLTAAQAEQRLRDQTARRLAPAAPAPSATPVGQAAS